MATIYLRSSDGNDSDDGSTWALAKATMAAAETAAGAGGIVFVSKNHAESAGSAKTLASPGTAAAPLIVLCVDDAGDPEPPTALATTATVTTTGANAITFSGFTYYYGITFNCGTGSTAVEMSLHTASAVAGWSRFDQCTLFLKGTNTANRIRIGIQGSNSPAPTLVDLRQTVFGFSATAQGLDLRGATIRWTDTPSGGFSASGSTPTTPFKLNSAVAGSLYIDGVDLSLITGTLASIGVASVYAITLLKCKLGSGVTPTSGTIPGPGAPEFRMVDCDSADTNYRYYRQTYRGVETHETTIVRTSGASDGVTPVSRKIVSGANVSPYLPYETQPLVFWNDSLSAVTVTVPVVTDGVTLTDADAWVEAEYMGASGSPLGDFVNDRVSDLAFGTPASQATSALTWTTTGLSSPVKQELSVTFTPVKKGPILVRTKVAKPNTTVYVDPVVVASSARQWMLSDGGFFNAEAASGGSGGPLGAGLRGGFCN